MREGCKYISLFSTFICSRQRTSGPIYVIFSLSLLTNCILINTSFRKNPDEIFAKIWQCMHVRDFTFRWFVDSIMLSGRIISCCSIFKASKISVKPHFEGEKSWKLFHYQFYEHCPFHSKALYLNVWFLIPWYSVNIFVQKWSLSKKKRRKRGKKETLS